MDQVCVVVVCAQHCIFHVNNHNMCGDAAVLHTLFVHIIFQFIAQPGSSLALLLTELYREFGGCARCTGCHSGVTAEPAPHSWKSL